MPLTPDPPLELTHRKMTPRDVLSVARANLGNLQILYPSLGEIPLFRIALMQLDDAIEALIPQHPQQKRDA